MSIKSLIVAIVCTAVLTLASHSKPCKYWCKSHHENVYYCCPSGKSETWITESMWPMVSSPMFWIGVIGASIGIHARNQPMEAPMETKLCPPMRSVCPRSSDWYDPPTICDNDEECHPTEKCCYDVCLEHKACKPAE